MSLDISLTDKCGDEIASLNWLRNPFGLERWAQHNVEYAVRDAFHVTDRLWYVCNHWNYKHSEDVDRRRFKQVVDSYNMVIQQLEVGYFWFDASELIQFVFPHAAQFKGHWLDDGGQKHYNQLLGIPQPQFCHFWFEPSAEKHYTLEYYKHWFCELVDFADLLQDRENEFYCSN
jgi:hypothetical protein